MVAPAWGWHGDLEADQVAAASNGRNEACDLPYVAAEADL